MDRETVPEIRLEVTATDGGDRSSTVSVVVVVLDVNDNRPRFSPDGPNSIVIVQEDAPVGTVVSRAEALDADQVSQDPLRGYSDDHEKSAYFCLLPFLGRLWQG